MDADPPEFRKELLGLGGMFCMSAALVGRKRTIASALDGLDLVPLFDALL